MLKLVSNKIRCKFCGDILYSLYVHDFTYCRCRKCSIDGGLEYAQRSFVTEKPEDTYEDLSTYVDENGKLIEAKDADTKDIPLKPIRVEIKPVEAKEDAVWEPWGDTKEPEKDKDGSVRYPHAGTVEMIDVLADNSKEPEAKAEEEQTHEDTRAKPAKPIILTKNKK